MYKSLAEEGLSEPHHRCAVGHGTGIVFLADHRTDSVADFVSELPRALQQRHLGVFAGRGRDHRCGHRLWPEGQAPRIFSCAAAGAFGDQMSGPVGAYLAAVVGAELGGLFSGKTKLDIILVPTTVIVAGGLVTDLTASAITAAIAALQSFLETATTLAAHSHGRYRLRGVRPCADCAHYLRSIGCNDLHRARRRDHRSRPSAGSRCSYRRMLCTDGGIRRLQLPRKRRLRTHRPGPWHFDASGGNSLKAPDILIPPTLTFAITGPLATTIFQMKNVGSAAGMGTSGLVGQFGT